MKFLARLFGSGDTVNKVVDGVIDGVDAMFFTEQERSGANLEALKLKIEWAKATTGSRLARRVLAFMFSGVYLSLVLLAMALGLGGDEAGAAYVMDLTQKTLAVPVSVIIGFYFATQLVRK